MTKKNIFFLIFFIFSFFISLFINYDKINIPFLASLYKPVSVDITFINEEKNYKDYVKFDNTIAQYQKINENHDLYYLKTYKKINKISFKNPKNIFRLIIYNGNEINYSNLKSDNLINNSKSFIEQISISILSFFYNFEYYIFSYIFLFLFLYNFKGRINKKIFSGLFLICFILGIIFRFSALNVFPFWDDEIYSIVITSINQPINLLFQDLGNPPLFYILLKIYRLIIQNSDYYRILSVIIGLNFNICFYFYIKKWLGSKNALIGLFFVSFSIILIYFSIELRCYILLMLLGILNSYYLIRFKKIPYLISAILFLYTHFYSFFYILFNFLFGCFYFKKEKKNFILINLIIFLSYIPLILTKMKGIQSSFNSWIKVPQLNDYLLLINSIFSSFILLTIFLFLIFWIYKKMNLKNKIFLFYNSFLILFIIICVIIFSYLIKPIFFYKYFYIIYPNFIALLILIINNLNQNIYIKRIILILIFLLFMTHMRFNYQYAYCNHNLFIDFIKHNQNNKNTYIFMSDTVIGYEDFKIKNTKPIFLKVNKGIKSINPMEYNIQKPCDCYVLNLYLDKKVYENSKKINLFKTPLGVFVKIEY